MADRIISMGPEGGDGGGTVVVSGTPERLRQHQKATPGKFLKEILDRDNARLAAEKKLRRSAHNMARKTVRSKRQMQ